MIEIVLGPPGTGKTTHLLEIVDQELERGTAPDRIGYFSFTKRAAEEAVTRAVEKFKLAVTSLPNFRTLHSHCFRYLGLRRQDIFEGSKIKEFARSVNIRITANWSEDGTLTGFQEGDRILFLENLARVRCVPLRQQYNLCDDNLPWGRVESVTRALINFKQKENILDYTDMLSEYIRSGGRPRLEVLIIDEAQDLSQLQWRVVSELMKGCRRIVIAGDDDQAIYPWAGADIPHFIGLQGNVTTLGQSWRVPRRVQSIADRIIQRVHNRRNKQWVARDEEGECRRVKTIREIDYDQRDTMILARNTYVIWEQVIPELRTKGLLYEYKGHPSIRPVIKNSVIWWESLRREQSISVDQARSVYAQISSGQGIKHGFKQLPGLHDDEMVDLAYLREQGGLLASGPWFEALDRLPKNDVEYIRAVLAHGNRIVDNPRIRLSTIHGSKGGQADHIILMQEMASRTYREYENNPEDEARVWYVAVTRSKQKLTLVNSSSSYAYPI